MSALELILYDGAEQFVALSMELASCQNYDALNFMVAPTFLENVGTQAQKVDCPITSQEIPRILS